MGYEEAMSDGYILQHDGAYVVAGTRVSLDSIVYAFLSGQSAEAIAQAFPAMNEQVSGAITYYLGHRDDVDRYLEGRREEFDIARQAARDVDPMFYPTAQRREEAHTADALNALPLSGRRGPEPGHRVCRCQARALLRLGTIQARDAFSSEALTAVGTSIATKRSAANR